MQDETKAIGRTAVVTGAGTGIGREVALELARRGHAVIVVGRRAGPLEETRTAVTDAGGHAHVLAADIGDPAWLEALGQVAPHIDVLVNDAAVFATYGPLEDVPFDEIDDVISTDLTAPLRLIRHVLPGMKARSFGRIVNVGSIAAALGAEHQVVYATAKSGLEGLTRSVALEAAAHGITCNLVHPGLVLTERTERAIKPRILAALIDNTPVGRAGTVAEIGSVVGFLCSDAASYVTGACIPVTGGLELGLFPPLSRE